MRQSAHKTAGTWIIAGALGNNNAMPAAHQGRVCPTRPHLRNRTHLPTHRRVCVRDIRSLDGKDEHKQALNSRQSKSHLLRRAGRRAGSGGRHPCPHPGERSERSHPSAPKCNPESFCLLFARDLAADDGETLSSRLLLDVREMKTCKMIRTPMFCSRAVDSGGLRSAQTRGTIAAGAGEPCRERETLDRRSVAGCRGDGCPVCVRQVGPGRSAKPLFFGCA